MRLRLERKKKKKRNQNSHAKLPGKNNNNSMKLYNSESVINTLEHQKDLEEIFEKQ